MSELRDSIKRWEHAFFESHGHKPSADDIRANSTIRDMYKRYHAAKRAQTQTSEGPITPQKPRKVKSVGNAPVDHGDNADVATDDDDATPQQNKVTEIFPTPQFQGRALGLFDLELSPPETPSKSQSTTLQSTQTPRTPSGSQQLVAETPMSKRTPDYFLHRTNIFNISPSRGSTAPADSPLVKRKPARSKSVSDLVKEATELQNLRFEGQDEIVSETPSPPPASAEIAAANGTNTDTPSSNSGDKQAWAGRVRKGPKRQTKRVTMRPVNQNDIFSMAKPTENYKRLNINHNRGKRPFRRR